MRDFDFAPEAHPKIDNTPLSVARDEGEADIKARETMEHRVSLGERYPSVIEFARRTGKLVIVGARERGLDSHEISTLKERMAEWTRYVCETEEALRELASLDADDETKSELQSTMLRTREERRIELFGEDPGIEP